MHNRIRTLVKRDLVVIAGKQVMGYKKKHNHQYYYLIILHLPLNQIDTKCNKK